MGKSFISLLTELKFNIWRVTFLKSYLSLKNLGMDFRFSHNIYHVSTEVRQSLDRSRQFQKLHSVLKF